MSEPAPSTSPPSRPWLTMVLTIAVVLIAIGGSMYLIGRLMQDRHVEIHSKEPPPPVAPPEFKPLEANGPPWFRDITADSGIRFTCRNGEEADQLTILESLGSGVALIDYDGDGLLDVFLVGGGYFDGPDKKQIKGNPCRLFKNLGGGKFQEVTKEAGLDIAWWYTHGVAVADYDRDGWPDLLVTGYGRLALFHNEADGKGGKRFVDVTEKLGLHDDLWSTGAGFADLDGDGYPDLYVCHYTDWSFANHPVCIGQVPGVDRDICPPQRFAPQVHAVFHNDKGQKFVNVTEQLAFKPSGYGLGVVLVDINGDGRPDVYVTNDMSRNFLFMNRAGKLEEKALFSGVGLDESGRPTASMGVDAADYDGSGRPSLFVTNFQRELPSLYLNLGKEAFIYQTWAAGLAALGRNYVGWGTSFVDVDNDGWEDLVIVNGHLFRHPAGALIKQSPFLLHNESQEDRRVFQDIAPRGGSFFQTPTVARGLAVGDLDNDGWPDVVINRLNESASILRNVAGENLKHRWLGVRLIGKNNRDVVGSTVVVDDGTRKLTRFVKGGGSYLSANDPRLLFGLGEKGSIKQVKVQWSWGETQTWDNLEPNHYYDLREGEQTARRAKEPGSR